MRIRLVRIVLLFVASLSVMCFSSMDARATINIAVVDVDVILDKSDAAKSVKKQVDKKRKSFIDKVKKEEDKLRKDQKELESKRADFSKEELVKKIQMFEKQRLEARNSIQEQKARLDKGYTEAMNTLTKSIFEVCQEIANEDKIDLVITRQNIIVGSNSLDITKRVMERLNKKLPKLSIDTK